jgi:hypothetical protein
MTSLLRKCFGLAVAAILSLAFSPFTGAAEQQVDVHFHFRNNVITLHEPVILMFTVHNGTAQEASFDLGIDKRQFLHFSLTLPRSTTLVSEPLYPEGFHASGKVVIPPGGDYEQLLVLNQWFRFDSVGEHFLAAQLDTTIAVGNRNKFRPNTERLQFEVKDRDPAHLTEICVGLTDQVKAAGNANAAREPALLLSYIEDPIAVPYLSQLLVVQKLVQDISVAGLERIGNADAVKVLVSALTSNYGDTSNLAREALKRILQKTSDPALKRIIIAAGIHG